MTAQSRKGQAFTPEDPQPLLRPIPTGAPYPVEALGPLREAVVTAQAATQAPVALAAQSALSVAALATQSHADVQTLGGTAPLSLFCLSIAESGERKSATDKLLMAGLRRFEQQAYQTYQEEVVNHGLAVEMWRLDREATLSSMKKKDANRTSLQADLEALGPEPEPPLKPFLTANEPTLEGLHRLFAEGQPSLGVFSDEGGGFIGGHGMNRDNRLKTITGLSDLWGGEPIRRVRAGDGANAMFGRRCAMHLMVQPVAAQDILADPMAIGQGFLPRFLLTHPPSAIGTRLNRQYTDMASLDAFESRLIEILETLKPLAEGQRQQLEPRVLTLSDTAQELLWQYYEATERQQAKGGDLERCKGFASKSPEQACRIAGVLTLWGDISATVINGQTMTDGIALAQFYLAEARRMADLAVISKETAEAEKLRVWLLENWPIIATKQGRTSVYIVPRDVIQYGPGSLREGSLAKKAIAALVATNWLVQLPAGTLIDGQQRREAYQIGGAHVV